MQTRARPVDQPTREAGDGNGRLSVERTIAANYDRLSPGQRQTPAPKPEPVRASEESPCSRLRSISERTRIAPAASMRGRVALVLPEPETPCVMMSVRPDSRVYRSASAM